MRFSTGPFTKDPEKLDSIAKLYQKMHALETSDAKREAEGKKEEVKKPEELNEDIKKK
jgi:hypothetical protein